MKVSVTFEEFWPDAGESTREASLGPTEDPFPPLLNRIVSERLLHRYESTHHDVNHSRSTGIVISVVVCVAFESSPAMHTNTFMIMIPGVAYRLALVGQIYMVEIPAQGDVVSTDMMMMVAVCLR